jgi:GNAT superfamily N-acetyltransferase
MQAQIRLAQLPDVPALESLIEEAVMVLQAPAYSEEQRRGALGTVFGVDSQLISDKTYFIVESEGVFAGCGGWSWRQTLFGGDAIAEKNDRALDPTHEAARIRAFFVKPAFARRGIGKQILAACETAAKDAGFKRFDLVATLTGVPLYTSHGYRQRQQYEVPLRNGLMLPVVRMSKKAS